MFNVSRVVNDFRSHLVLSQKCTKKIGMIFFGRIFDKKCIITLKAN